MIQKVSLNEFHILFEIQIQFDGIRKSFFFSHNTPIPTPPPTLVLFHPSF
jgi:hypothetical protein